MAKREEIEAQIAELQKQLEDAEDEYEIEIRDGDKAVRMPAGKGTPWLKKHFSDLYEEPLGDGDDSDDDKSQGKGKTKPPADDGKVTRFGRRVS